jgi:putative transcriptional regulator
MGRNGNVVRPADAHSAGERVRFKRRALNFSQQTLADAVSVSRQTILSMESGDYAPSVYLALAVAKQLMATVEEIWGEQATAESSSPTSRDLLAQS